MNSVISSRSIVKTSQNMAMDEVSRLPCTLVSSSTEAPLTCLQRIGKYMRQNTVVSILTGVSSSMVFAGAYAARLPSTNKTPNQAQART